MKTQLLLVLAIVGILAFLPVAGLAQSVTTTSIDGLKTIDIQNLGLKGDVSYFFGGKENGFFATAKLPVLTYTHDSEQLVELDIYTDFNHRAGIEADINVVPINNIIQNSIGKNSGVNLPILTWVATNWVQIEVGVGVGYNFNEDCVEGKTQITLLKQSFSTGK